MTTELTNSAAHTYQLWQDGEVGAIEALRALANDLLSLDARKAEIDAQCDQVRSQISHIVGRTGKVTLQEYGTYELTSPVVVTSYDREQVDRLIRDLLAEGQTTIAQALAACSKESARPGYLKVTKPKREK